jgi:hypothetical protein
MVERDENLMIDRSTFEPTTGRAVTERTCVRDGQVRRFTFAVRMFIGVELKGWLIAAGSTASIRWTMKGQHWRPGQIA